MDQITKTPHRWLWLEVIFAIALIAGGIGWLAVTRSQEGAATAAHGKGGRYAANGPMPVTTFTVQKGDIDITLNELGTVTPLATVTVRTQIAGQLMQINFQEGQLVNKGDLLALIDPRPYEAALAQAQGALQRDQALLEGATHDLARYTKLVTEDSIARQQRDDEKALVDQYKGTVETDKAQINTAQLNLQYCHIVAPVSGRVGLRQVDPGNYAQVTDTNGIVVITQLQPMSVLFSLPEDNLPTIMKRMATGAVLPVIAFDRSQTNKLATGQLSTVDNEIDPTTGTIKMRALFDNADNALFSNQFVNIQLLVDTVKDVIVVPSAAVKSGAPGTYVYTVKSDSTVAMTPVKLGPASGESVSVTSGLSAGDIIVRDGADKLKDGAKVLLPGATQGSSDAPDKTNSSKTDDNAAPDQSGKKHHHKKDSDQKKDTDQKDNVPPADGK